MFPKKYEQLLFGLVLSGVMSLLVSGISTLRAKGLAADFLPVWIGGWLIAWIMAFPTVLVVAPLARRIVQRMVAQ